MRAQFTQEQLDCIDRLVRGDVVEWLTAFESESYNLLRAWTDRGWFAHDPEGSGSLALFRITEAGIAGLRGIQ